MRLKLLVFSSGLKTAAENMAMDEALLLYVQSLPADELPVCVVRTYCWSSPTLSLGLNQSETDIPALFTDVLLSGLVGTLEECSLVRRPTGGRAIFHGDDVSFSFVSNAPALCQVPLKESYQVLSDYIQQALQRCGVDLEMACRREKKKVSDESIASSTADSAYTRSSACFKTRTASDLVTAEGLKVVGSAQRRLKRAVLQHGSAFLKPFGVTEQVFSEALFSVCEAAFGVSGESINGYKLSQSHSLEAGFDSIYQTVLARYDSEASEMRVNAARTSGSHLVPASL